jgi:hypothetical protein
MTDLPEANLPAMAQLLRLGDLATPFAIRAATSLGLADLFDEGQLTVESLAERGQLSAAPLQRLVDVLIASGVVTRGEDGTLELTKLGRLLRRDEPYSMHDAFGLAQTETRAWAELEHCVRTGESGFERAYGESHRSYRAKHLEEDRRMDLAHRAATRLDLMTLVRAYPWGNAPTIVDVGGGSGMFLAGLLSRFTELRGTLFDLPRMVVHAPEVLRRHGVEARCEVVGGDFFDKVPAGAALYVLKAVVGGWSDDDCVRILGCVRRAMTPESRLLVIEPVMGAGQEFTRGNAVQLHTLVLYGGRDRSLADYQRLGAAAELKLLGMIPRATLPVLEFNPI